MRSEREAAVGVAQLGSKVLALAASKPVKNPRRGNPWLLEQSQDVEVFMPSFLLS
jgi:hypothetical protein